MQYASIPNESIIDILLPSFAAIKSANVNFPAAVLTQSATSVTITKRIVDVSKTRSFGEPSVYTVHGTTSFIA